MMAMGFMVETIYQMAIPLAVIRIHVFNVCVFGFYIDAPRCKPGTEQSSVGSINMHSIDVRCEVDADPAENIRFSWTYNNTRNVSPVRIVFVHPTHIFLSLAFFWLLGCFVRLFVVRSNSVPSIINQLILVLFFSFFSAVLTQIE